MLFSLPPTLLALVSLFAPTSAYRPLSDSFLRAIPSPGDSVSPTNSTLLSPLLIPRVPGTPGQTAAQHHLVSYFSRELPEWRITWQNSTATTPLSAGVAIPFANLIVKREPPWVAEGEANLLTLVAHYDSKFFAAEEGEFVGATDSAAPCAMLMHVAKVVDPYIQRMYDEMAELGEGGTVDMDMGIQILFLDGEEAFQAWTDDDSLYGSRALANAWSSYANPPSPQSKFYQNRTPLSQISLFLLLDLLGSRDPTVPSYFPTTHWAYIHLSTIESRMRSLSLLESQTMQPFLPDVNGTMGGGGISDDHLPFMGKGVEVLHVIPSPFPGVWHTVEDDGEHLDEHTVRDWCKIVGAFVLEWLDMMEVWDAPIEGGRK